MLCHFPPPLPNISFLGDFNIPGINWSSLNSSCPTAGSLLNLTSLAFLNQEVSEPTRNCNILDLIFLSRLKLYSLQEKYSINYVWKIVEGLVPNLSDPINCSFSDRRGRTCIVYHAGAGGLDTLKYNTIRW